MHEIIVEKYLWIMEFKIQIINKISDNCLEFIHILYFEYNFYLNKIIKLIFMAHSRKVYFNLTTYSFNRVLASNNKCTDLVSEHDTSLDKIRIMVFI